MKLGESVLDLLFLLDWGLLPALRISVFKYILGLPVLPSTRTRYILGIELSGLTIVAGTHPPDSLTSTCSSALNSLSAIPLLKDGVFVCACVVAFVSHHSPFYYFC